MKMKMLSMATAVIMAVICLTGCSNAFKADSIVKAAEKYSMDKMENLRDMDDELKMYSKGRENSAYYVSKNDSEANLMYAAYINLVPGTFPDISVEEFVYCIDTKLDKNSGYNRQTEIYMVTAKDEKSASELYDVYVKSCSSYDCSSGEKDGYTYTIAFIGNEDRSMTVGLYLKGKTLIKISGGGDVVKSDCSEFFCKEIGLISPQTLEK